MLDFNVPSGLITTNGVQDSNEEVFLHPYLQLQITVLRNMNYLKVKMHAMEDVQLQNLYHALLKLSEENVTHLTFHLVPQSKQVDGATAVVGDAVDDTVRSFKEDIKSFHQEFSAEIKEMVDLNMTLKQTLVEHERAIMKLQSCIQFLQRSQMNSEHPKLKTNGAENSNFIQKTSLKRRKL